MNKFITASRVEIADGSPPVLAVPQYRFLRRLPVMLYRLGLGPLLGVMPLLVLSTRAKSGAPWYTPLEYRRHGSRIYVLATGRSARWLSRIENDPNVSIRIGLKTFPVSAEIVTDEPEAVRALFLFRMRAPIPLRWLYWSGRNQDGIRPQKLKETARKYTFVRLERASARSHTPPAVPPDRAWLWPALAGFVALVVMAVRSRSST